MNTNDNPYMDILIIGDVITLSSNYGLQQTAVTDRRLYRFLILNANRVINEFLFVKNSIQSEKTFNYNYAADEN